MKYALHDNAKIEAKKGAKGTCPICSSDLIAKCGEVIVNHWAHKGVRNCDPWWEPETEWHRSWKNNFSKEWQEIILHDEITGEKHIADVRTEHGVVIEFQHSHIDPLERRKRESFYKKMIWIADGTRLKRDYPRFLNAMNGFRKTNKQGYFFVNFPDECFPTAWLGSSVPVIFDFKGTEITNANDWRSPLYYLFPKQSHKEAVLAIFNREELISSIITGEFFKQKEEPPKQTANPTITKRSISPIRQSQFVFYKGRYVRKRRW